MMGPELASDTAALQDLPLSPLRDAQGLLYLRTIARALKQHLLLDPECAVHWISVLDENSMDSPSRTWWYDGVCALDDCLLQVSLAQGFSEGMLLYVYAQPDRYKPAALTPLLRIKLLCGPARAAKELLAVWRWFNSKEFHDLVAAPANVAGV